MTGICKVAVTLARLLGRKLLSAGADVGKGSAQDWCPISQTSCHAHHMLSCLSLSHHCTPLPTPSTCGGDFVPAVKLGTPLSGGYRNPTKPEAWQNAYHMNTTFRKPLVLTLAFAPPAGEPGTRQDKGVANPGSYLQTIPSRAQAI